MFGLADRALAIAGGATSIVLAGALAYTAISGKIERAGLRDQLVEVKGERDRAKADLTTCRNNTATLKASIAIQNAAADAANAQLVAQGRLIASVAAQAQDQAKAANVRADKIMAARPSADKCASADALILESLK